MKWPADNRSSETVGRVLRLRNTLPALVVSAALALLASCAGQPSSSSGGSPEITQQPVGQTVLAGHSATFTVSAASNSPLSYQWRKNGSNIAGANSSTYTTPPTTMADNGSRFQVMVSNPSQSTASSPATLTVDGPLSITTQPANQTVNVGHTATFTVVATGAAPLSYQWQKNQVNIAGATSASYTTPATTSADNGTSFRVIVTNPVTSVTSNAATLTVNTGPSITTQPANQTVNVGQTATFTVVATGAAPAELSVAEEPGKYRGSDVSELHDASDDERGQWNQLPGDRHQSGHERDEQCGDANGERRARASRRSQPIRR